MLFLTRVSVLMLLASVWLVPAQGQVLFSDTFTGMDRTRPPGWQVVNAPAAGYWFLQAGEFSTGNCDYIPHPSGFSYAVVSDPQAAQWRDYELSCTAWVPQRNGSVVLVGRWRDADNHYEGVLECYRGARYLSIEKLENGERIRLVRRKDGDEGVMLPAIEGGTSSADRKTFSLSFQGNLITFTYEGASISVRDDTFTNGTAGLGNWYFWVYFDNFVVRGTEAPMVAVKPPEATGTPGAIETPVAVAPPAPPPAVPGAAVYRLVVGQNLSSEVADNLKTQLLIWGYVPVDTVEQDGKYNVVLGSFLSYDEAERQGETLQQEGLVIQDIVALGGLEAEQAVAEAPEISGLLYRVLVQSFDTQEQAQAMKQNLEKEGYVAIDVLPVGDKQGVVVGGFPTKDEGEKFVKLMARDGYILAKVISAAKPEEAPIEVATAAPIIPSDITQMPGWETLTDEERSVVTRRIEAEQRARSGDILVQEIENLKGEIEKLSAQTRTFVQDVTQKLEEEKQVKQRLNEIFSSVDRAIDQGDWERAVAFLDEARQIDNTHPMIEIKGRAVDRLRKGIRFEGQEEILAMKKREIERLQQVARAAESRGDYEIAISHWESIRAQTEPGEKEYEEAKKAVVRLSDELVQKRQAEARKGKLSSLLIYVVGGIGVVVVVLLVLFVLNTMRARRRDRELLRQVQEIAAKPMLELEEHGAERQLPGEVPGAEAPIVTEPGEEERVAEPEEVAAPEEPVGVADEAVPFSEEKVAPERPIAEEKKEELPVGIGEGSGGEVDELDEAISLEEGLEEPVLHEESVGAVEETGHKEPAGEVPVAREAEEEPSASHSLEEIVRERSAAPEQEVVPEPLAAPPEIEELLEQKRREEEVLPVSLDEEKTQIIPGVSPPVEVPSEKREVEPPREAEPVKAAESEAVEPPEVPSEKEPVVAKEAPPAEEARPPAEEKPKPAAVEAGKSYFEQGFDDLPDGEKPKNWVGEYEYAELRVTSEKPAPGSKKCLKFEKRMGAGSAYYYCTFPEARNKVAVEFDICCDDKNKYLLGFYVENNRDFRQSVHTIIHRTETQTAPSLRLHGEPVPYELGSWRHVKYVIDLLQAEVDASIDGKLIVSGIKLLNCPPQLNTLSIRDNLATTGTLRLANVKIYAP